MEVNIASTDHHAASFAFEIEVTRLSASSEASQAEHACRFDDHLHLFANEFHAFDNFFIGDREDIAHELLHDSESKVATEVDSLSTIADSLGGSIEADNFASS